MTMRVLMGVLLGGQLVGAGGIGSPVVFTEACDASAALAVSGDEFVVANDEDNLLRFYRFSQPGAPTAKLTLELGLPAKKSGKVQELDLEGVTRWRDLVFFITSHGRNSSGKAAPDRHRLFAINWNELQQRAGGVAVGGTPYTNLVRDLAADPQYAPFELDAAAGLAPKSYGALNIEALTATAEGTLLIGFRNPIPGGRALLASLQNPVEVLTGKRPRFGAPVLLDLGGLGLRGMTATTNGFYLLAGPGGSGGRSRMYYLENLSAVPRWLSEVDFAKVNPEGICQLEFAEGAAFLIVSDDGTRKIGGQDCKTLPEAQRQFRAYRWQP